MHNRFSRLGVQLGKAVADNLLAFDQKFWIRLATRSDTASSQEQKDRCETNSPSPLAATTPLSKSGHENICHMHACGQEAAIDD